MAGFLSRFFFWAKNRRKLTLISPISTTATGTAIYLFSFLISSRKRRIAAAIAVPCFVAFASNASTRFSSLSSFDGGGGCSDE
jgi:hypothetical protein